MPVSREVELEREIERLKVDVERLTLENTRLRAEVRRVHEELDWRDEKIRGYGRAWDRIATRIQHLL